MIRKGLERKAGKGSCQLRYREGKKLPSSLHSQPAQPPRSLAVRPSPVIFSPPSLSRTIQLLRSRPLCALSNSYSSIWACWRPDLSDPARDLHSGLAFYSLPESARAGSLPERVRVEFAPCPCVVVPRVRRVGGHERAGVVGVVV
jgi:hypothetical protein